MKKFRKILAGVMALSLMFTSAPQITGAYDVQIIDNPKLNISESRYADAVEITDEYIKNVFLADMYGVYEGGFVYLDGKEHKVYAHDKLYTENHKEREPGVFYITFEHENRIAIRESYNPDGPDIEALVNKYIAENNIEGVRAEGRTLGTLVIGNEEVNAELADKLGEYLKETGVVESVVYTPSYKDAVKFVIINRYPLEYASLINNLIAEQGLSRSDIYVDVSHGESSIIYTARVTQKQMLELAAAIYRETGYIADGNVDFSNEDVSDVWIDESYCSEAKEYITSAGVKVTDYGAPISKFYDGAVKITDDRITAFYSEVLRNLTRNKNLAASNPLWGNFKDFYAFDTVKYDNSKYNGEYLNRKYLTNQVIYSMEFTSTLTVDINENDTEKLRSVLDEKFGLSEKNIIIYTHSGNLSIQGLSELTTELADSICKELNGMGYTVNAAFQTHSLTDGMTFDTDALPAEYPVSKQDKIMAIVKESGVNAKVQPCHHYTDDESGYFDLIFDDVYNTTQMDAVNLRVKIFEETGECGLTDAGEFKPEYKGCLQFGLTDATTAPDKTTYVDIKLGQNTGFNNFVTQINYDHDKFELVSASLRKDFENKADFKINSDKGMMMLMNKKADNLEMSNEDVIRLAFKVKENTPDGKYEISLSAPESQESGVCSVTDSIIEWVKPEFTPGYITVDSNAVPKTQTKPMPLNRMYADISAGSAVTGDTNSDGKINAMDALATKSYLVGIKENITSADTNEDGIVNIQDLLILSDYITG